MSADDDRLPTISRGLIFFGQVAIALVWLYEGLVAKLLGLRPDEREIISSLPYLPDGWVTALLWSIGGFEILLAIWVIFGGAPRIAAIVQTLTLLIFNGGGLVFGPDEIGDPVHLVITNLSLVALIWIVAMSLSHRMKRNPSIYA